MRKKPATRWVAGLLLVGGCVAAAGWLWRHVPSPPPASHPTGDAWPLLTTEELLERHTQGHWAWARWSEWPDAVVVQFPSLESQGAALNRLAAWKEKGAAPRDRLLDDLALATLIHTAGDNAATFYGGHDYRLQDVQAFFDHARKQHVTLNPEEHRIQETLHAQGWLPVGSSPGVRALISFSDLQGDNPGTQHDETVDALRRESVLRHELSHARFFLDAQYRERCHTFWHQALTPTERQTIQSRLSEAGYDVGQPELIVNEAQALLFHTRDPRAFVPHSFGLSPERLKALREQFARQGP
ncbi:hypothetical protein [Inhella gelatinilytica]|uniref:Uncharacterized protein n=1 Tax=Inhella gelatinilytica TaxID=2795030 RepID=A0A931IZP0_9BURK|nr:hypothetical protein [Inhella gelatinilytica]MBH9554069.1 hypothetical protein [Inhella gelatinilytica]